MAPQICIQGKLDAAEEQVLDVLHGLPDEAIVYAQPKLVHKSEVRYPDFVIVYHMWGVIVLEVKDWLEIVDRDGRQARVRQRNGKLKWRDSPVEQARTAAQILSNELERDEQLVDYAGKRDFSYAYGGVLPYLLPSVIRWLESAWGETYLLGRDDLRRERITDKIARIHVPFRIMLNPKQVDAIRAIIDRRNKNVDRTTGEFKGIYDREQEGLAKERLPERRVPEVKQEQAVQSTLELDPTPTLEARIQHLEEGLPDEVKLLKSASHVRLVRGFAGTGKTDVLILRAHYLYEQYPDLDILVTTFNHPLWEKRLKPELKPLELKVDVIKCDTLCAQIYRRKHGCWVEPQSTEGLVAAMAPDYPLIEKLGRGFVSDEFVWMKETDRTVRERYVGDVRRGRGAVSQRTLGTKMKNQVFDLFEAYQERLHEMPAYDWVDLHDKALRYLEEGVEPEKRYDVILVDEAQHFAPTWMRIIDHFLKPGGSLFLCDDPSQSVYRYYSWRQKGVGVVGRTRWLRIPYRNTRQIFEAAYALIEANPLAQGLLAESGEQVDPDLDSTNMRDGDSPEAHLFPSVEKECDFVVSEISRLIEAGIVVSEIGILHEKKHVLNRYQSLVPDGVQLYEAKRQTGLEYKVVFIPQIQQLFERAVGISWEEDKARNLLKFYMSMTRARDRVYLLYSRQWPKLLEPLRPHVRWIKH